MPSVTISVFEGRGKEEKQAMADGITKVICDVCKCPPEAVSISFVDTKRENSFRAGVCVADRK